MSNGWTPFITHELENGRLRWLVDTYEAAKVYPAKEEVFRAFKLTPYQNVRVVIIGQDPYHTPGVANGLAFSSKKTEVTPPSLVNIFKAIKNDLNIDNHNTDLSSWASQGVLLMNTALTVEEGKPGSHTKEWISFTNQIIDGLNKHPHHNIVFLLWGQHAQAFESKIASRHTVLKTSHPSPFSAHKGFLDCKHFSKVNEILQERGESPINWSTDVQKG